MTISVLITECGGPAGIGIIKSFRAYDTTVKLVGIDCGQYATGFELCDVAYQSPKGKDPDYISFVKGIVTREAVDLIVCAGEHDLLALAEHKDQFPCTIIVSSPDTIRICQDKWLFYQHCKEYFDLPLTMRGPIIQKPVKGAGSRGFQAHLNDDMLYQEYLPGAEYTVDIFCRYDHTLVAAVPRERLEIKSGISTKSRICPHSGLIDTCARLAKHLKLVGACNIQFRADEVGILKIMEINPRLGGSTCMSLGLGINFAELYMKMYSGKDSDASCISPDRDYVVVRYYDELIFTHKFK